MYLRHSVRRKNGKRHTYWRLVRALRRGGKVVQETVAQLGELDAEGRAHARLLAQQITGTDQQRELFEPAASEEQRIAVRLESSMHRTWAVVRRGVAGMEVVAGAQVGRTLRGADA